MPVYIDVYVYIFIYNWRGNTSKHFRTLNWRANGNPSICSTTSSKNYTAQNIVYKNLKYCLQRH